MTPLVKSTSRPIWQRMPNSNVFYYSSPNHNYNYILSLAFNFDKEDDVYHFSLCYPYSYSKCQAHLDMIEKRNLEYFKRELLGLSLQKRRIDLLTITNPKNMTPNNGKVHVVVILGRIHPGESPASYVLQALIDYLISDHAIACALRDKIVFKIIPMLNPDGVFLGNHRCSLLGMDLNRSWSKISKWLHPTLNSVYSYIVSLDQDKNIELDFILDIHAHSYLRGAFIYGNTYENVFRYERHIVFPKLLSQNVLGFERAYTVFNRDSNKSGSARRVFCDVLKDSVNCYSLNISFYGYYHAKSSSFKYYTEETYYKVGRNVVQSFGEFYRSTGVLDQKTKRTEKRMGGQNDRSSKWKYYGGPRELKRRHSAPTLYSAIAVLDFNCSRPTTTTTSQIRKRSRSYSQRRKDPSKLSQGGVREPQQPSLTIIDFNSMARDLDKASGSNRLQSTEKYL